MGGGKNLYASVGSELRPETSLPGFESVRLRFFGPDFGLSKHPPQKCSYFSTFQKAHFCVVKQEKLPASSISTNLEPLAPRSRVQMLAIPGSTPAG